MICPNCEAINKDNAHICRQCGIRLSGRMMRSGADRAEKRYLKAGAAAALAILAAIILLITAFSCICGGCQGNADETHINDNVGGEWAGVITSGGDVSGGDVTPSDQPAA